MQNIRSQRIRTRLCEIGTTGFAVPAVLLQVSRCVELQPDSIVQKYTIGFSEVKAHRIGIDLLYPCQYISQLTEGERLTLEVVHILQHGVRIKGRAVLEINPLT